MPKYRFDWASLPHALLWHLATDLDLTGDPAKALKSAFGARPDEDFVRRAWPTLLEHWVSKQAAVRRSLASGLFALGLGDPTAKLTTAREETAYLRSCRNSPKLRRLVLEHLIAAGEEPPHPKDVSTQRQSARAADSGVPKDWSAFAGKLAASLEQLEEHQYLVVSLRRSPDHYVQFAQGGVDGLRAETASNAILGPDEQLDDHEEDELRTLGWRDPDPDRKGGSPNYYFDWSPPVPYTEVVSLAVRTFNTVLSVSHPRQLTYRAFGQGGTEIIIPTLGIPREPMNKDQQRRSEEPEAKTPEELLEQVKRVMKPILGVEEIVVDEDGDIPVRYGNVVVYVRVLKDIPLIKIFSPVVFDIGEPADILKTVNQINQDIPYAKATWNGKAIIFDADVIGVPLAASQLEHAYVAIAQLANEYAKALQERYGGRVTFGPSLPAKETHMPGYL